MSWPILILSLTEQFYIRIWCSTMICEANENSGQIKTLPAARRQNSRLRAFSSDCGPETEMVGPPDFAAEDKLAKKATQHSDVLHSRQCKSSEWPT